MTLYTKIEELKTKDEAIKKQRMDLAKMESEFNEEMKIVFSELGLPGAFSLTDALHKALNYKAIKVE